MQVHTTFDSYRRRSCGRPVTTTSTASGGASCARPATSSMPSGRQLTLPILQLASTCVPFSVSSVFPRKKKLQSSSGCNRKVKRNGRQAAADDVHAPRLALGSARGQAREKGLAYWRSSPRGRSQEFIFFIIRGANYINLYKNLIKF